MRPSSCVAALLAFGLAPACGDSKAEIDRERRTVEASSETEAIQARVAEYARELGTCPGGDSGETPLTPPLDVACTQGQFQLCIPGGHGPGSYPWDAWAQPEGWRAMMYVPTGPHAYHYRYRWRSSEGGCQFTVQAFGDLDDDRVFSTYERVGRVNAGDLEVRPLEITDAEE